MVLLSSHKVERKCPLGIRAPQQMRAASGDPRRGAIPVELIRSQPSGDFPMLIKQKMPGCRGQIGRLLIF